MLMVSALTFLNYRVPWWPLHPVGFTVAFAYPVRFSSFSLFVAWLVKWVILKVGGISLYRRAQVAVLGVLAGYTAGAILSFLVLLGFAILVLVLLLLITLTFTRLILFTLFVF